MVEKMKKLYFLIYHKQRAKFMSDLQNLGAVHLEVDKSIQTEQINEVKSKVQQIGKSVTFLTADKPDLNNVTQIDYADGLDKLVGELQQLEEKTVQAKVCRDNLQKEYEILEPWGDFEPKKLDEIAAQTGYNSGFYAVSSKQPTFKNEEQSDNLYLERIFESKGYNYYIVFYKDENAVANINGDVQHLPEKSLSEIKSQIKECDGSIESLQNEKRKFLQYKSYLDKEIAKYNDDICYKMADASLSSEVDGKVLYIEGWIPQRKLADVEAFLQKEDVAYLAEDPSDSDDVPIVLKNNRYAKLFEPVTKMHSLPGYHEIDPTPFFAPFFMAFFGLCLADMGYGLVMLAAVIAGLIVMRKNKAIKPVLWLGFWLSVATVVAGFLLNVCFGMNIKQIAGIPDNVKKYIFFPDMNDQMSLALMLGIIQVLFGYVLQVVGKIKFAGIQAALQPLGTMGIIVGLILWAIPGFMPDLCIGPIAVGSILGMIPNAKTVGLIVLAVGVGLVLLFNNIQKSIFIRPVLGLWEMYNIATGIPGDILSYIRLFALGLAGGMLGGAFNQIGGMILGSDPGVVNYVFMILILVLGHTINFALAALSAFVHPLRLVLLEFYKAYGFVGGGRPFRPFKHTIENNN